METPVKPSELAKSIKSKITHPDPRVNHLNIIVKGAPGIGKTEIILKIAKDLGWDYIIMHPQILDPTKFEGLPWISIDKDKAVMLPFSELKQMIDAEKPLLVFMDDMIQAPPAVQAAVMQLIQARRVNEHVISDQVRFVAATNRETDRAGGTLVIEPLKSRYLIYELMPNSDDWCSWAQDPENGVPPALVGFIRMKPSRLFDFKPSKKIENYPCPRTVYNLGLNMMTDIPQHMELTEYTAAVGRDFAADFVAFMKIRRKLPHPMTILKDPMKANIPDDTQTLYALCSLLCEQISENTADAIVQYARRLNDKKEFEKLGLQYPKSEFSVFLIKSCISINEEIKNADSFVQWCVEHQDLLIN